MCFYSLLSLSVVVSRTALVATNPVRRVPDGALAFERVETPLTWGMRLPNMYLDEPVRQTSSPEQTSLRSTDTIKVMQ